MKKKAKATPVAEPIPVPEVTDVDIAFGGGAKHLPPMSEIPEEFKRHSNPCAAFIGRWFFEGVDATRLTAKPGVDLRVLQSILGSFEPKHEHKEAGCAYLLSQWFDLAEAKK